LTLIVSEKGKRNFSKYFDPVPLMSYLNVKKGTPRKKRKERCGKEEERSRNKNRNTEIKKKISMKGGFATPLDNSGED
jgi:hypothetical protein